MKVKCISPHGGAHHGTDGRGEPVTAGYDGPRQLPPNEGGYIDNGILGRVAVGSIVDAPGDFIIDGYHFEAAEPPKTTTAPPPTPTAAPAAPAAEGK
jgi:hypothetical protein